VTCGLSPDRPATESLRPDTGPGRTGSTRDTSPACRRRHSCSGSRSTSRPEPSDLVCAGEAEHRPHRVRSVAVVVAGRNGVLPAGSGGGVNGVVPVVIVVRRSGRSSRGTPASARGGSSCSPCPVRRRRCPARCNRGPRRPAPALDDAGLDGRRIVRRERSVLGARKHPGDERVSLHACHVGPRGEKKSEVAPSRDGDGVHDEEGLVGNSNLLQQLEQGCLRLCRGLEKRVTDESAFFLA